MNCLFPIIIPMFALLKKDKITIEAWEIFWNTIYGWRKNIQLFNVTVFQASNWKIFCRAFSINWFVVDDLLYCIMIIIIFYSPVLWKYSYNPRNTEKSQRTTHNQKEVWIRYVIIAGSYQSRLCLLKYGTSPFALVAALHCFQIGLHVANEGFRVF